MSLTLAHPKLISLAAGFTDNASLPVDEARALLDEILSATRTGQPALQYGSTAGDPLLRELTAKRLTQLDAQATSPAPVAAGVSPGGEDARQFESFSNKRGRIPGGRMPPSTAGKDACLHIFRPALSRRGCGGQASASLSSTRLHELLA